LWDILIAYCPESVGRRKTYLNKIAQCAVAMIVNDKITLGAMPLSVAMHLAVGTSDFFEDQQSCQDLVDGWAHACELSRCVWGCGETPTLPDIIYPGTLVLSGSAIGIIAPKSRLIRCNIQDHDAIVLIKSSGIHANGLTLARRIGEKLPQKYLTVMEDGRKYGEALLESTIIYVPLIDDCLSEGIDIHYAINITGHGWRKLMRAPGKFFYYIEEIPEIDPVFKTIQEYGPVDDREAYGNLNMGAGFALYVPDKDVDKTIAIAAKNGLEAMWAGTISETSDEKQVYIAPKHLTYKSDTLSIR
jgi:phosphoribosylformylglycinamidine cyclo-ligase